MNAIVSNTLDVSPKRHNTVQRTFGREN